MHQFNLLLQVRHIASIFKVLYGTKEPLIRVAQTLDQNIKSDRSMVLTSIFLLVKQLIQKNQIPGVLELTVEPSQN